MTPNVLIIDYGMGNLLSVKKTAERFTKAVKVSSDPNDIMSADKLILPGVGHFEKAMKNLKSLNIIESINECVIVKKRPILGICLGMQLMAQKSEEGESEGLNWLDADVIRFRVSNKLKFKVPHTGWNQVKISKESLLMKHIPDGSEFYFVHSYHMLCRNPEDILNVTEYEYMFCSAIEKENIYGVQYHPEKSHDVGAQLIKNFIHL